jgi:hypothetical protein
MSKSFAEAPKPKPLTSEAIVAFERGGLGHDTQTHIPSKAGMEEPTRRLSLDVPVSWHRRFKTACSKCDKKMVAEVLDFIKRRTLELEAG